MYKVCGYFKIAACFTYKEIFRAFILLDSISNCWAGRTPPLHACVYIGRTHRSAPTRGCFLHVL